ncbi:spore germination protein KB [Paenibacillaceae bacterium GAS479]|nr:spore germination protein KB [Paenibacillaceae bacterium GAS479]
MGKMNNGVITARQFKIIIIFSLIGDTILILPNVVGNLSKQDAWISMLIAVVGGMLVGGLFAGLIRRMAGHSLISTTIGITGRLAGGIIGLALIAAFYITILTLIIELSLFMTTQMMPETPSQAIVLSFLIVTTVGMRYGVESFARMSELLFPIFIAMFLFLTVCLLPQIDFHRLAPVASSGFGPILQGGYPAFAFAFLETATLLMLVPNLKGDQQSITRAVRDGFLTGGILLFIVVLVCILVLGPTMMEIKYYPTFLLAQRIEIGQFLERLEAFLTFLWIVTVFYKTLLYSFSIMKGLSEVFELKEERFIAMPLSLLLLAGSQINVPNVATYAELLSIFPNYDMVFYLTIPLLLYLLLGIPAIKRRLERSSNSKNSGANVESGKSSEG